MELEVRAIERDRHYRALWYLTVSLGLALVAHLFLGFDSTQTFGYAVSCFVMLNVVNFRAMFGRLRQRSAERQPSRGE